MNLTREQVAAAVQSGLEVLGENSEVSIPAKHVVGVYFLKQLLNEIGTGKVALAPVVFEKPDEAADE